MQGEEQQDLETTEEVVTQTVETIETVDDTDAQVSSKDVNGVDCIYFKQPKTSGI